MDNDRCSGCGLQKHLAKTCPPENLRGRKPYEAPKLTGPFTTPELQKAAVEAAKHEASCEILDLVVDLFTGRDPDVEGFTLILEVLREWQHIHEDGKRKALDHFVGLVQAALRAETETRL